MNICLKNRIEISGTGPSRRFQTGILAQLSLVQMAVVAKYGAWDNATYPWEDQTSAGMMGSIVTEIDAWITAISSNASIVANGMLPVKRRDPSSSTNSGVTNGFVYEFPDTSIGLNADGPTYPHLMLFGTQTNINTYITDEYANDTSNNGYGNYGSSPGHYTSYPTVGDTGYNNQAIVITETTDGEEFLAVGIQHGAFYADNTHMVVFKDQDGHWCFTTYYYGFAYDNYMGFWTGSNGPYDNDPVTRRSTTLIYGASIECTITGSSTRAGYDGIGQVAWFPKSSKILSGLGTSARFGQYRAYTTGEQYLAIGNSSFGFIIPA